MSFHYPQCAVQLRILPEDYQLKSDPTTQQTYVVNVLAREVVVNRNDYKTTDTFSMEIDYKSFPFDPRTIRACGVAIFMQDGGSLENRIVPDAKTQMNPAQSNCVFIGFVDEDEIEFDDSGRRVKFTGRDCTALLIDQKYQVNSPIFPTQPLDVVLTNLLAAFSATQVIKVINTTGGTLPAPASYYADFGSKLAGGVNVGGGAKESYWDIIQHLVGEAGLICYMGLTSKNGPSVPALFLSTPKNQNAAIDPVTGQQATQTADDIKVIYGKNIKRLELKRKLGRLKNINIMVRSRVGKQVLTAKIPLEATPSWCKAYGIQQAEVQIPVLRPDGSVDATQLHPAPYLSFPYKKVANKAQLVQIGQTIYEQYSLQMLEGSFETKEMLGFGMGPSGPQLTGPVQQRVFDLTQIQKGTLSIEVNPEDMAGVSRLQTVESRAQYLLGRGYEDTIASLLAKTIGKMSPRFQIKDYTMAINDDGFKLSVRFWNLIDNSQRQL